MSDFGSKLKQAREQRGISQRQIAATTKISVVALEALERNDFSRLPGGIFSRAFVRSYAIEVGLDPDATVEEFLVAYEENYIAAAEKAVPQVTDDDLAFLERQRRAARWLRGISIGLGVVLAGVVIAWRVTSGGAPEPEPTPPPPAAAETPALPPVPPPADAEPPPVAIPEQPAVPGGGAASSVPETLAPSGTPGPVTAPPAEAETQVALRLQVTGDCWVRATVDGTVVLEEILHPGDSRVTRPGREVYLQVGNAGAVEWAINGQPARPLGGVGQTATARISQATVDRYLE